PRSTATPRPRPTRWPWPRSARQPARPATMPVPTNCATVSPNSASACATRRRARRSCHSMTDRAERPPRTDLVYGLQPVREALRGRRRVREIVCTREAAAAMPWIEAAGVRVSIAVADRVTALAERPDHQGVVAICDPFPYADAEALLARPDALVVALDGVTDPRNLGAIVRSCECLGAHGLVIPRHGSAGVTAVVAKASAGAVEHL